MKYLFTLCSILVALTATVKAQALKIWKNGEVIHTLENVDSVTYADPFNGYEYVDLGLPSGLLWASCNVGALSPYVAGKFYAWGETEDKPTYYWGTYKFMTRNGDSRWDVNKYTTEDGQTKGSWYGYGSGEFCGDSLTTLLPEDDAAHVNMGGEWRMPTIYEIKELYNNCLWLPVKTPQYSGYEITGRNGNKIFLPISGYWEQFRLWVPQEWGYIRSSTLSIDDDPTYEFGFYCTSAQQLAFTIEKIEFHRFYRYYGYPVRGVIDGKWLKKKKK